MLHKVTADGITWLTGQSIDSLLDSCGVVAVAAGPRTVLVNSRLAELPAAQRELLLAQELSGAFRDREIESKTRYM